MQRDPVRNEGRFGADLMSGKKPDSCNKEYTKNKHLTSTLLLLCPHGIVIALLLLHPNGFPYCCRRLLRLHALARRGVILNPFPRPFPVFRQTYAAFSLLLAV
jgi:hypothetical protein